MRDPDRRILDAVRAIPEGFVRTYGDISPGAPRAAGRALSSIDGGEVPWWRVVRSDGSLAVGEEQRRHLEREGVPFRPGAAARVDLRVARIVEGWATSPPRRSGRDRRGSR